MKKLDHYRILVLALPLATLVGSGCMQKRADVSDSQYGDENPGIEIAPPPSNKTVVGVADFSKVISRMSTATGVSASAQTYTIFDQNKTSFPLYGNSSEITPAQWMATAALAGSFCQDLYNKELSQNAESRLYYRDVSLGATNDFTRMVSGSQLRERVYQRLAMGFWGRRATAAEIGHFNTALSEGGFNNLAAMTADQTRRALLMVCSGALGSLEANSI